MPSQPPLALNCLGQRAGGGLPMIGDSSRLILLAEGSCLAYDEVVREPYL